MNTNLSIKKIGSFILALVLLIIFIAAGPFQIVGTGEVGVVTHFGKVVMQPIGEGFHLVFPIWTKVTNIDTRIQKHEVPAEGSTKDLQGLTARIAVNFRVIGETAPKTFQEQGGLSEIVTKILAPETQEAFKTAAGLFTAEGSITERPAFKDQFDNILTSRMYGYGIEIKDTNIVDIDFTQEFMKAVEEKQIAEQKAQQAKYVAKRKAEEAVGRVNQAKGEAEAQELLNKSLTPELLMKQMLDNQLVAIQTWDGSTPQITGGAVPFVDSTMFQAPQLPELKK